MSHCCINITLNGELELGNKPQQQPLLTLREESSSNEESHSKTKEQQ